jgi:hypothetical protein
MNKHRGIESVIASAIMAAAISQNSIATEDMRAAGRFVVKCHDADGNLKWTDHFDNLVTTAGGNDLLDKYLAGSAYTATWYLGLIDGASAPTIAAADTMASHAGWTENVAYSQGARPTAAWSAAAAKVKALSAGLVFTANAAATIAGAFLTTISTKGGTTGILFSAGTFSGGNKTLASGESLTVSYQLGV